YARLSRSGYLLLFTSNHSHGKPFGIDFGNQAKAISDFNEQIGHSRDLVLVRVAKSFADDSLQSGKRTEVVFGFPDLEDPGHTATPDSIFHLRTSDKYNLVPKDGLRFRYLTKYAEEKGLYSASRPKIIALSSNKFVVLWESWTMERENDTVNGKYDSTWAMVIDMNGNELVPAKKLSGTESLRLNSGDDAFLMDGKAAWVNGNGSALVLHTVDSQLGYKAVRLP
uniref:hypothetical protein n=1 Tax=Armatimonas sp. TaxID=1872638 RepID=UPI00286CE674